MVSVGGLASGLDTSGIINQLIDLERRPIRKLEVDIAQLQQVQATFTGFASRFSTLREAARGLSLSQLETPRVVGGDGEAVTITARSNAAVGRHEISVARLATASRVASQGFADADATPIAAAPGTFTARVGNAGAQISIAVTTSTTLLDLANAINAAGGDIRASIIDDGTNRLSTRLVLGSTRTGRGQDIQILSNPTLIELEDPVIEAASADASNAGTYSGTATSSGTFTGSQGKTFMMEIVGAGAVGAATYRVSVDGGITWDDNGGAGFVTSDLASAIGGNTEGVDIAFSTGGTLSAGDRFFVDVSTPVLSEASDAVFSLDGITQTRSSNTVTGALAGVTFELGAPTAAPVRFSVEQDDEAVVTAVQGLVDAYNGLFNDVRGKQSFDPETLEAGLLLGDRTANAILSSLRSALSRTTRVGDGRFGALAEIGVRSSRTGGLSFDAAELRAALATDRRGVLSVLASTEATSNAQLGVVNRPTGSARGNFGVLLTAAPERARVVAAEAQGDGLGGNEVLSFSFSRNFGASAPTTSGFGVTLLSGDTQAAVLDRLNSAFATQGAPLRAFSDAGVLTIESTEFGADMWFSVVSDTATGAGTSRLGTAVREDSGADIAGTIGGQAATGIGNRLTVGGDGSLAGLAVDYTGTATGLIGDVTLGLGAGSVFLDVANSLSSGTGSVVGARTSSIQDQIDQLQRRIATREAQVARIRARLEEQFAALEVQLSGLQSQSDFLSNQLAQLSQSGPNNSSRR